ncbi:MAG: glycosyltransferase [Coriobacteriia bacterium]|nr:glycosyltransferase [Coriobacteriia bacterium]
MKILHAPLDLASVGWSLTQGFRALGQEADFATIATNRLSNAGNIDLSYPCDNSLVRQYKKYKFCARSLPNYDVVHYHAGRSIFDYGNGSLSLLDLKAASKRDQVVAMTYHGCEVRGLRPELCHQYCTERVCEDINQHKRVQEIKAYVDLFYVTTPDLLSAVPYAKLLPQSVWGMEEVNPIYPFIDSGKLIRIMHAPSKRSSKGSSTIINECEQLIAEGYPIEFILIENLSHDEALQQLATADIVIDNIITGWYGVLAVEAASRGKVVVTSIEESFVQRSGLPAPPFIGATPETFKEVLEATIENQGIYRELGCTNRRFALERHSATTHAGQLLRDYAEVKNRKTYA